MTQAEIFLKNFRTLFEAYKRSGGTQTTLAQAAGATQGQISHWLTGTLPSIDKLPGLARAFSVSVESFFNEGGVALNSLGPQKRELVAWILSELHESQASEALVVLRDMLAGSELLAGVQGGELGTKPDQVKRRRG